MKTDTAGMPPEPDRHDALRKLRRALRRAEDQRTLTTLKAAFHEAERSSYRRVAMSARLMILRMSLQDILKPPVVAKRKPAPPLPEPEPAPEPVHIEPPKKVNKTKFTELDLQNAALLLSMHDTDVPEDGGTEDEAVTAHAAPIEAAAALDPVQPATDGADLVPGVRDTGARVDPVAGLGVSAARDGAAVDSSRAIPTPTGRPPADAAPTLADRDMPASTVSQDAADAADVAATFTLPAEPTSILGAFEAAPAHEPERALAEAALWMMREDLCDGDDIGQLEVGAARVAPAPTLAPAAAAVQDDAASVRPGPDTTPAAAVAPSIAANRTGTAIPPTPDVADLNGAAAFRPGPAQVPAGPSGLPHPETAQGLSPRMMTDDGSADVDPTDPAPPPPSAETAPPARTGNADFQNGANGRAAAVQGDVPLPGGAVDPPVTVPPGASSNGSDTPLAAADLENMVFKKPKKGKPMVNLGAMAALAAFASSAGQGDAGGSDDWPWDD